MRLVQDHNTTLFKINMGWSQDLNTVFAPKQVSILLIMVPRPVYKEDQDFILGKFGGDFMVHISSIGPQPTD